MKPKGGFTLIEVLVVLFIMSIIFSLITLNLNQGLGDKRKLENTAQHIINLLQVAQQEASLKSVFYRFVVEDQEYGIQKRVAGTQNVDWQWDDTDKILCAYKIHKNIQVTLLNPIILYPTGALSPFNLHVILKKNKNNVSQFILVGEAIGNLKLTKIN